MHNKKETFVFATIDCSSGSERASVCDTYETEDQAIAASRRFGGFICAVEFGEPIKPGQRIWKANAIRVVHGAMR